MVNSSLHPDSAKALVNEYMTQLFATRLGDAGKISQRYETFWKHTRDVALAGGKRIRPYLTMVGYGAMDDKILPVATAQELIHIAMLIHDDIIDQDDIRHGQKNMNGLYREEYGTFVNGAHIVHYAHSAALLAGDALISEAYRAICDSSFEDGVKRRATEQLHLAIYEVIGGELLDVEAAFVSDIDFDPLQIYRYKTSSYSFIGPLLTGAYCAGANESTIHSLRDFATTIGIAFQMQDDLMGVFGDEARTGKSTLSDLHEGKYTLIIKNHRELMNDEMRQRFEWFGKPAATAAELEPIKKDIIQSGAYVKTTNAIDEYFLLARRQLEMLDDGERRTALEQLLDMLTKRGS